MTGSLLELEASVQTAIDDAVQALPGVVSIWYGDIDGNCRYAREQNERHYAASTMKLPLLVAAYRLEERGEVDLDDEVDVHNEFASTADGSPYSLSQSEDQDDETWARVGGTATLRQLTRHAIVKSGNLATNLVLERIGHREVSDVLADAGCSADTVVSRGIEDAAAYEAGLDNTVTAADLAAVMCGIASRTLAKPQTCAAAEAVLALQEHRDAVPAGLPHGVHVANKTGWVDGVTHDVALVRPEGAAAYVLVVCTTVDLPVDDANALIARISAAVWVDAGATA
jgi:beta-lactamase class A